jgi:hypothetical protein
MQNGFKIVAKKNVHAENVTPVGAAIDLPASANDSLAFPGRLACNNLVSRLHACNGTPWRPRPGIPEVIYVPKSI